jgi:predicted nuclease of restriction endonuclease-like RecB superfamily
LPIKPLRNNELRIMPQRKPGNIERNIYNETQGPLLNAFNMIQSMMNRHRDRVLADVRPENIGDITKLANAMSALIKSSIEVEKWEYVKSHQLREAMNAIMCDARIRLRDHPELADKMAEIYKESMAECEFTLNAQIDPTAMLEAGLTDNAD